MNIPWTHRDGLDPDAPPPSDFPQRDWCFGSAWLDGGLADALGLRAMRAEVENVHYVPDRQLQVVYRLRPAGDRRPDDAERVTLDFEPSHLAGPDRSTARTGLWLATARARAWFWPDDPAGLPLARWLSSAQARQDMPQAIAQALPAEARLRASLLSYSPGERLALRWQVEPRPGDGLDAGWVMKAQRQGVADTRALHRLWRDPSRHWGMAEPLDDVDTSTGLRWERFLPGVRLEEAATRDGWDRVLQQAAEGLVALHRQPLDGLEGLPRQTGAQVHGRLDRKVMRRIRGALPGLAERAQSLADRLGRHVGALETCPAGRPAALLHGDLHTGNLLRLDDGRIAFIDLDSLMVGDPAWDLALLSTRLMLVGLLDPAQATELDAPLAAWPQTYIDAGGDPAILPSYRWHVATLLLSRQVKTCVRHHAPGMTRLAAALLAQAEAIWTEGTQTNKHTPCDVDSGGDMN
jgi:hypothetical protein